VNANHAVVIVNYNSWPLLEDCLRALSLQTFEDFEVIVLDNGSDQQPPAGLSSRFPGVEIVLSPDNLCFAAGNNQVIRSLSPRVEWVVLLNPDTRPATDWLQRLVEAAAECPDVSVFASRLVDSRNPRQLDGDGDAYHMSGLTWRRGHRQAVVQSTPTFVFSPCAAAAMYRVRTIERVGLFDEDFFCYVEDVDLGFRLQLAGEACLLVPGSVVAHVGAGTSDGAHGDFALYHGHRNLVWCYLKYMPPVLFWALLPLHVALNITTLLWFSGKGRGATIWRAKRDAVKGLPAMWRKRRTIQAGRSVPTKAIWKALDKRVIPERAVRPRAAE
jgi:GT2 family glycosyltransferase